MKELVGTRTKERMGFQSAVCTIKKCIDVNKVDTKRADT